MPLWNPGIVHRVLSFPCSGRLWAPRQLVTSGCDSRRLNTVISDTTQLSNREGVEEVPVGRTMSFSYRDSTTIVDNLIEVAQ